MRKAYIPTLVVVGLLGLAALGALKPAAVEADRPDCPGKIICPETGELICRDQCPTVDPDRPDCPGRIVCPLTGELICKDRCPLNATKDAIANAAPSCCSGCCAGQGIE